MPEEALTSVTVYDALTGFNTIYM